MSKHNIRVELTPKTTAELIIRSEIDLFDGWGQGQARQVLDEILNLPIDTLLSIVDGVFTSVPIGTDNIPQFGKIENVVRVPQIMLEEKALQVDFVELGFLMKKDPTATMASNQKFGENHGKVASQIGIITCVGTRFVPSVISDSFVNNYDEEQKMDIATKLFIRVPIIRALLRDAKDRQLNGYDYMNLLERSTKERRGSSIRTILKSLKRFGNDELDRRIDSVTWEL